MYETKKAIDIIIERGIPTHKAISLVNRWESFKKKFPSVTNIDVSQNIFLSLRPDLKTVEDCNFVIDTICKTFDIPSYGKSKHEKF